MASTYRSNSGLSLIISDSLQMIRELLGQYWLKSMACPRNLQYMQYQGLQVGGVTQYFV